MQRIVDILKKNRKIVIPMGIAVILLAVFLAMRGNRTETGQYQTVEVERGELVASVGATGTVRAKQTAILVWQTNGTVERVNADVGDTVEADEELAALAPASVSQTIISARAELVGAQKALDDLLKSDTARVQALIALDEAQERYDKAFDYRESLNEKITYEEVVIDTIMTPGGPVRVPRLKTYKYYADEETIADADADLALAKAQLEDAQRAYDRVKDGPNPDDVAAAQARVDAAQATLNMARIIAPFDGTVTEANPLPGDQVSAGTTAFRVDNLSSLFVDVEISEVDINSIAVGQPVTLTFDAILGEEYHGEIVKVAQAGSIEQGVVNFTVTVELTDADAQVKPGMTAAVTIVVKELQDVLVIPNRAVRLVNGQRVVYVLRDGLPVMVEVRLGSSSDTESVLVGGDVQEGDLIILNPPVQFEPGGPGGGGGPF
jgi:HlyD family secretion protein